MLRLRWKTVVLPLLVASSFVVLPATPSLAAGCSSTALVPVVHEFLVSQGSVPSAVPVNPAVPFPYVQGKDTLFKVFLSLPSCASRTQSIVVTGGTLTVRNGAFTLGAVTPSFSPVPDQRIPGSGCTAIGNSQQHARALYRLERGRFGRGGGRGPRRGSGSRD